MPNKAAIVTKDTNVEVVTVQWSFSEKDKLFFGLPFYSGATQKIFNLEIAKNANDKVNLALKLFE